MAICRSDRNREITWVRLILPMCNQYVSPDQVAIERFWHVDQHKPWRGESEIFRDAKLNDEGLARCDD